MNFKDLVLNIVDDKYYRPMTMKQMLKYLDCDRYIRKDVVKQIQQLHRAGKLEITKKGKIVPLSKYDKSLIGKISIAKGGYGFFVSDDEEFDDVFISNYNLNKARNNDKVKIKIIRDKEAGKNAEGVVVDILQRNQNKIVGLYQEKKGYGFVVADDRTISEDIFVDKKDSHNAKNNDKVVVKVIRFPKNGNPEGKVLENLGNKDKINVDILSIVRSYGLKDNFSKGTKKESLYIEKNISEEEIKKRKDFRNLFTVTIDGRDSKDFDDAISIEKDGDFYILYVHIADVSHYVKKSSSIDEDAYTRGNSTYLYNIVIPMLPEVLSNGICSLNPMEERLAISLKMKINEYGKVIENDFYKSVIKSNYRLIYDDVNNFLDKKEDIYDDNLLREKLYLFKELYEILNKKRIKRGSLDFNFSESQIDVSENGEVLNISRLERGTGNKMIEEFMLISNETVASLFYYMEFPSIYRVHGKPKQEKVEAFNKVLNTLGHDIKGSSLHPKDFQKILKEVKGKDDEELINLLMLRTMQKAKYTNYSDIHFGLATKVYTHFTSPIRRYPDLIVHRLVSLYIENKLANINQAKLSNELLKDAEHLSITERNSEECERDVEDLNKCKYMKKYIGKIFDGVISSITDFGIFIELDNTIEGLFMYKFSDDRYEYFEDKMYCKNVDKNIIYKIGQREKIFVTNVDIGKRNIDFTLVED